jgi:hypothetical protein
MQLYVYYVVWIPSHNLVLHSNIFSPHLVSFYQLKLMIMYHVLKINSKVKVKVIFSLINDVLQALNDRKLVGSIFYDLTNTFDSVNNEIILAKMDFYGI